VKKEYTLYDVTRRDAMMLVAAASLSEKTWYCYGSAWYRLSELELIDDDMKPTAFGIAVASKVLEEK
jgi:hypothetical protein